MAKIKTFEEACNALNISKSLPEVKGLPEKHQKAITAHYQLVIIAQALNEGWEPNWNDGSWKYYPWFKVKSSDKKPSGSGLSYDDSSNTFSRTFVGSRLCYKTEALAKYAGTKFKKLYEEYMLI